MPAFRSEVMVGRERELEVLREVASRVWTGQPATALVIGEAGIGKTRLAAEFIAELETAGILCPVSHGVELAGGDLPFGATAELVRALVRGLGVERVRRVLGPQTAPLAALVPALGTAADDHRSVDRPAVLGAALTLLEGLDRPICWLLDDLQWMDAATRDLVAYLARVLAGARVLLVATVRTDSTTPDELPATLLELGRTATVLPMSPLSATDVAAQVAAIVGQPAAARQVARICDVSDGIPFFVEQLVASGGHTTGSLRAVVLAGIGALSPPTRTVLRAAAVGEGLLVPGYLEAVAGVGDAFGEALAEARQHGVLRPDREGEFLQFRHALLREAIDTELLADERLALHDAWARVIEESMPVSVPDRRWVMERARHRYAVGGDEAFPAALAAAGAMQTAADDELKARWWGRALKLWPAGHPVDEATGLVRDRAVANHVLALWDVGDPVGVVELADRELADESDWSRALWLRLIQRQAQRAVQLSYEPVVPADRADATLSRLRETRWDFRVAWLLTMLAMDWQLDRPDLVEPILEEVIQRTTEGADATVVHNAFVLLGWCQAVHGDPDAHVELNRRGVDWVREHQPSTVLTAQDALATSLVNAGRYAEAISLCEAILAEARDPRLMPTRWVVAHVLLATATQATGDWDRAVACVAAADTDACGGPLDSLRIHPAVLVHARRGEFGRARAWLDRMPESFIGARVGTRRSSESIFRAMAAAELAATEADVGAARAAFLRVAELTHPQDPPLDVWETAVVGLRAASERGSATDAETAGFAEAVRRELATRAPGGRVADACGAEVAAHLARIDDRDTADQWSAVCRLWVRMGRVYDEAHCQLFEAECALRDGDRERAGTTLRAAWRTCDRLGAVPLRGRVEAAARRGRVDHVGGSSSRDGLTAREVDVLRLLAEGQTNGQIADALFISRKTASVHVSHIIAKLGVANRTEAAAVAHRRGLASPPT